MINFFIDWLFSLKKIEAGIIFLALIENVPLMKLILSAAYFDIINKSFNIAYYNFYKQKLREIWVLFVVMSSS
jgi:hypothetical protein